MSTDRPDPSEFFEKAQQMMRELFGGGADAAGSWGSSTRPPGERSGPRGNREPSAQEQRENLTFALATRAVEALEDLSLNVAAIRQRLERVDGQTVRPRPVDDDTSTDEGTDEAPAGDHGGTTT